MLKYIKMEKCVYTIINMNNNESLKYLNNSSELSIMKKNNVNKFHF